MDLEETQYGSRKDGSRHDAFKQISEFVEYNKKRETGIITMDVEGGFDRVDIDILSDIMMYRGAEPAMVKWVRRWASNRSTVLKFNGRVSKTYYLNKGVPQGSPLSPYLFGVYVSDVFRPRF